MDETGSYDYLTGLYNRKGLTEKFHELAPDEAIQLMFFDLDNFKTINDMYGHKAGDETLCAFTGILHQMAPENAMLARLGGDEFVLLMPGFYMRDETAEIAKGILRLVHEKKGEDVAFDIVSASIGVVWDGVVSEGLDELLSHGDSAMYLAKEFGKDNFVFFDDYEDKILAEKRMEMEAVKALEQQRFVVRFRPVINLENTKLIRTESCCVWITEDGAVIDRNGYRAVLEKNGGIRAIDLNAFEQACKAQALFKRTGRIHSAISIVLSYLLILQEDIVEVLGEILRRYDLEPADFEIKIEEAAFGFRGAMRLYECLDNLSNAGFSVALTRFGEDFSSFRYLDQLPISAIEFDAEFVRKNLVSKQGKRILSSLFGLGKDFKLLVIGDGVESAEDVRALAENGCDAASGSYYGEQFDVESYIDYIYDTVRVEESAYVFSFKNSVQSMRGDCEGVIVGEEVDFTDGISDQWGGVRFPGGTVGTNVIDLPAQTIPAGSHTIAFWLKPAEIQNWISAFFVRYEKGFESLMPSVSGALTIYRRHPDTEDEVWDDVLAAGLPIRKWAFVTAVYDSFNAILRFYVDGELIGSKEEVSELGECTLVRIGGDVYQDSFRGVISALQIYGEAKTGEEIRELYRAFKLESNFRGDDEAEAEEEYLVHDPAIFEDPQTHRFYLYTTDGNALQSHDLVRWETLGRVVDVPEEARAWTGSDAVWAPDIVKVGAEYRLYCSNSSWGVQRSCIFLAVSDSPKGPFRPKGIVLKTDETLDVNGIDANIVTDHKTQEQYLLYGSFWGGIHLLPLDRESGFAKDAGADGSGVGSLRLMPEYREGMTIGELSRSQQEKRRGICLARRPRWNDGAVEGAYMVYLKKTGYYYLFVSYGSLKSDYHIRVGRSRTVTGPFLDYHGRDLADAADESCVVGHMIACGYKWLTGIGYMGPGHNSILLRESGEMFLVCHIRKQRFCEENPGPGILQIRRMNVTDDGWPILTAQPYRPEALNCVRSEIIPGVYERIELRPSIPQGIMHAHPMELFADGRLEIASIRGSWERTGDYTLRLQYGGITEFVAMEKGLDVEREKTTVLLSGLSSQGICTWAKKKNYF